MKLPRGYAGDPTLSDAPERLWLVGHLGPQTLEVWSLVSPCDDPFKLNLSVRCHVHFNQFLTSYLFFWWGRGCCRGWWVMVYVVVSLPPCFQFRWHDDHNMTSYQFISIHIQIHIQIKSYIMSFHIKKPRFLEMIWHDFKRFERACARPASPRHSCFTPSRSTGGWCWRGCV